MDIKLEELEEFVGGWEYSADFIQAAFKDLSYGEMLNILEFGSGAGAVKLANLLESKGTPFKYVAYENDPRWVVEDSRIETVTWTEFPRSLKPLIYDLVLIDGPNGVVRAKWYPLLREVVRPGTILAIDDHGHYEEFQKALDENFKYDLVEQFEPEARRGVTWKVVRVR